MDSVNSWPSHTTGSATSGGTGIPNSGVWGNVGASSVDGMHTGNSGSQQTNAGKTVHGTNGIWPGMESAKQSGSPRWCSVAGGGGNLSANISGGWGGTPDGAMSGSGWGSLNPSPVPNTGTESWGSKSQLENKGAWPASENTVTRSSGQDQIGWVGGDTSSHFGDAIDSKPGNSPWGDDKPKQATWPPPAAGEGGATQSQISNVGGAQGAWGRGNPIQIISQQGQQQPQQPTSGTWAQAAGKGLPTKSETGEAGDGGGGSETKQQGMTHDEMIAQLVNSNEGWGRVPIRQDTPWVVNDSVIEQNKPPLIDPAGGGGDETVPQLGRQVNNGTAIWESSKDRGASTATAAPVGREGGWGGCTPLEKASMPVGGDFNTGMVGAASAFRPPVERPPSTVFNQPPDGRPTSWVGAGIAQMDGGPSWDGPGKKNDDDGLWDPDIANALASKGASVLKGDGVGGMWGDHSAGRRCPSTTGEDADRKGWGNDLPVGKTSDVDDGTSHWGDQSGANSRPPNWLPTPVSTMSSTMLRPKSDDGVGGGDMFLGGQPNRTGGWPGGDNTDGAQWNSTMQHAQQQVF